LSIEWRKKYEVRSEKVYGLWFGDLGFGIWDLEKTRIARIKTDYADWDLGFGKNTDFADLKRISRIWNLEFGIWNLEFCF
jgi:hypothetical protein